MNTQQTTTKASAGQNRAFKLHPYLQETHAENVTLYGYNEVIMEANRLAKQRDELLAAAKVAVCDRLGDIAQANKWADLYRDCHAGKPDKGLMALIAAIAKCEK
jgi:hypothetical protein